MDFLRRLFDSDFLPQGHSYQWQPEILWLHVGSDLVIALVYFSVPLALVVLVRRRSDLDFSWMFYVLSGFTLLCGTTHLFEIWTVWNGTYRLEGTLKLATAAMSLATAIALWPVVPRVLRLPSPAQLAEANQELRREVDEHRRLESELIRTRDELEQRVAERAAALRHSLGVGARERDRGRQREAQFRRAVEASPAAFVLTDAQGRIQLVNTQTELSFGYDRGELVGELVEMLVPESVRPRHPELVAAFIEEPRRPMVLDTGRELHGRRKDGTLFPVEISLSPIETPDGVQVLAAVLDITERKRAETTLRKQTFELARSNRELEEFASVVSHDLKSPLRGIASLVEWIVADYAESLDEEGRNHLALLHERTVRMHRMIEGILEYSRAGRGTEQRQRIDVAAVLRGVVDALAPPPNVEIRIQEPLPECYCNEIQLSQVFQNLIGNSIQHLGKPCGVVTVSGRASDTQPGWVEFAVADTGVGIPPEHHERIFKIFQTLQPPEPGGKGRSTGIGLSIVQKIVEQNGGHLAVESTVGEGATIRFTMPEVS